MCEEMMSLLKTMENADLPETSQIIYHSKGLDESYLKWKFNQILAIS